MSIITKKELRQLMLYQVYVRNHTKDGTFKALVKDLNRIKELGTDVLYLIPIHEIGQKQKKGELGCPYSIKDFRSINPEYGTLEDFVSLIESTHEVGMKMMIDVVYNHTSHDSVLIEKHPEYFYKNKQGEFSNRVGDWWDITDLDYTKDKGLWEELISTLEFWAKLGVDGFRWDVASLLPLGFLEMAHERLLEINPDIIFLSESVHGGFVSFLRNQGFDCLSESEIYQVFDMSYDYDLHPYFEGYLKGENTFKRFLEELKRQEEVYPENYIKMRNLENHDFGRFAPMVDNNLDKIYNWTALAFFSKGSTMIYAGQEFLDNNKPSLFDKDLVNWDGTDISPFITKVAHLVKEDIFSHGNHFIRITDRDLYVGSYQYKGEEIVGIFNVGLEEGQFHIDIEDGIYENILDNTTFTIKKGMMDLTKNPIIFRK
jgi:glycosidase